MKDETRSYYAQAVRAAVEKITAGLDDALDLGALARTAALSPLHFHHVFRGMVGETPLGMHRRLRLERAAQRLAVGDTPVTLLAYEAGYETHESFTRAFRLAYAASPSEFRTRAKTAANCGGRSPAIELAARSGVHFGGGTIDLSHLAKPEEGFTMNVDIETMPELTLATVRHVGPYSTISEAFGRLGAIAGPAGLFGPRTQMIAIYHDAPDAVSAAELRSDAGITVGPGVAVPKELSRVTVPAGRYAKTTHRGPYSLLGDVWARFLGQWIPASGHRIAPGVSFEIYRNDPSTAKPEELLTDVYVPIA